MNSHSRLSQMRRHWNAFANLGNVGAYDYFSQVVELNSIEETHLQACKNGAAAGRNKVLATAVHEYTHWVDHVGTLWGQRHLVGLYEAIAARSTNLEAHFHRIPLAHEALLRIRSEQYYRTKGPAFDDRGPWRWTTSVGTRFDAYGRPNETDPICFISFNHANNTPPVKLVTRVPLTALALTECNALCAELAWAYREAVRFGPAKTPASPQNTAARIFSLLYNAEMAEYSAAFHLTANLLGISNLPDAMLIAGQLARLALNTPTQLYGRLPTPYGSDLPKQAVDRWHALFARRDVGAAFFALTWAARDIGYGEPADVLPSLIERVFGGRDGFQSALVGEAFELYQSAQRIGHPRLMESMDAGRQWLSTAPFNTDQFVCEALDGQGPLPLPPALLGDDHEWQPTKAQVHRGGTVEWVEKAFGYHDSINEFLSACGRGA